MATYEITAVVGVSSVVIRASTRFAGGIFSLVWNGKEFLDSTDHGRLLQSALTVDGLGECWNPTEGGSWHDDKGVLSTSVMQGMKAEGNFLHAATQMAFWLRPGETSNGKLAKNTSVLSDHILTKWVKIGHPASDHVIDYKVNFYVSEAHESVRFEALTAYMPGEFLTVWRYDPKTGEITPGEGQNDLPLIFTPTDDYALGIYAPGAIYDSFNALELLTNVTKWNALFTETNVKVGNYAYQCYVVVGTLENVKVSMTQLYNYLLKEK